VPVVCRSDAERRQADGSRSDVVMSDIVDNCARLSLSGLLFLFGPRGGLSDLRSGPIGKIEIG
jgi:hypothetical protein